MSYFFIASKLILEYNPNKFYIFKQYLIIIKIIRFHIYNYLYLCKYISTKIHQ